LVFSFFLCILGSHVLICTGGIPTLAAQVDSQSEILARRLLARAIEKKHGAIQYKDILQEPYATAEFNMFCNLRLLLTRSGVGKCVIVARDVDVERMLMLWTSVMAGLKISFSTCPVPTPEERMTKAKQEALQKSKMVVDAISTYLKK
jgi:hypothetical protein